MSQSENQHLVGRIKDGVLVVEFAVEEIHGEELAIAIRKELKSLVEANNADKVVLDFQKLKMITSRGLGSLAGFHREFVRDQGGKVALCNVRGFVKQSLTATRFITHKGASPLANIGASAATPTSGKASPSKPLFQHVTPDVDSAIQAVRNG